MTKRHPSFERIALILQGGGALGAYQAGVYQALAEEGLHPDWVAGISIGAINSALIAGNAPEKRVDALRDFWQSITTVHPAHPAYMLRFLGLDQADMIAWNENVHGWANQMNALATMLGGAPDFFKPRTLHPLLAPKGTEGAQSFYDVTPLRSTLERLVDFDRINSGEMRFSVGAVNVRTGNFTYFDTTTHTIGPEHIMASGALPPGFPAVEIDGDPYWDGGLVSNTPLQWVLENKPRRDTLAFQVDLWSALGEFPGDLISQDLRLKDIRFSSRTRYATTQFRNQQRLRRALARMIEDMPDVALLGKDDAGIEALISEADEKVYNIIHLIYRAKNYEGSSKDYEFSAVTMQEHWNSGYADAVETLKHKEVWQRPETPDGVATFDIHDHVPQRKARPARRR